MSAAWRKAFRDLGQERTRTAFVVLAIALGIAGFTAVLSSYAILTRELNKGYLATNPASAVFHFDRVTPEIAGAVLRSGDVAQAEARRTVSARIRSGPAQWRSLVLFVVKDFSDIRVSTLVPQRGAWPPAPGEILVERDAMQVIRARIGDNATIRTSRGDEKTLRISGTVHDVGQAQARMENIVYGYATLATLEELGEEPFLDQLLILASGDRFSEPHIRAATDSISAKLAAIGVKPRRIDIPPPGKHPHADIMGVLLLAMSAFGLCILALTGVLVVNLITGLMAAQIPQIGVMKAVGGSAAQIGRIYLAQASFMGLAAAMAGVIPGILAGRALCTYMSVFLNFDMSSMSVPFWVFALVLLAGIATPLLAASFPVSRACGVSVREALADNGASSVPFGSSRLDRFLAAAGGSDRPLLLALRDGLRRRTRFLLTVATLTIGGIFFMSALNTRASLVNTLDALFAARRYDLSFALAGVQPLEKIERAARATPGLARFEGWLVVDASLADPGAPPSAESGHAMHGSAPAAKGFTTIALPPRSAVIDFQRVAGRGLAPGGADEIVVNTALASRYPQLKPGAVVPIRLGPAVVTLTVVGVVRESFAPPTAWVSRPWLENRGGHGPIANSLRVGLQATDEASLDRARAAIEQNLSAEGIRVTGSSATAESRYGFDQHMVMIYVFLVIVSAILAGVGGLGLATTLSVNVTERRREMAVLRTIGATPATVCRLIVVEGIATALFAWAIASTAAWPVSKSLSNFLAAAVFQNGVDFSFETKGLFIWLGVSLFLGAAASILPAWRAAKFTIREALTGL